MRHNLLSTSFIPMAPSSFSSTTTTHHHHHHHLNKKPSSSSSNPNPNTCTSCCSHHSPSATLDILILILVLFSGAFLVSSYFSYIFHSLSLILPPISLSILIDISSLYLIGFFLFFVLSIIGLEICCGNRSRKCGKKGCKGLKKAMEFDLQLQTEEILRSGAKGVKEMEELPWKGGSETNPDYECLRTELRKMAPMNGRAVLLFRSKCGCPVAKLEGWGPKRGRRNKKSLSLNHG
ncbi:uncharacterized protein At5g19025-like [Cynara cardunculus var. scolymus]|uniref:Ribosomal protein L34Ae n=1 Tax=Cynara cardunculus var. scolymus TaxID=59895 RepID=A0A103XN59_CYNCS|nr:uncharacterized protein At5g19025-like [Cynara cardunculus var. scolymus]KVH93614.1 Ribosomal protein L34Ae [Cynara cardunculus var. scolymus]